MSRRLLMSQKLLSAICLHAPSNGMLWSVRRFSSSVPSSSTALPDPSLLDATHAPQDYDHSAVVYRDFIRQDESDALLLDLQQKLKRWVTVLLLFVVVASRHDKTSSNSWIVTLFRKRMLLCSSRRRYSKGHWDAVIVRYKETELTDEKASLSDISRTVLDRVRRQLLQRHLNDAGAVVDWLPCHTIDLHADGQLKAHVDSVRYSGGMVAGLSMLSGSIMRLRPSVNGEPRSGDDEMFVDLHLPPLSLYVLSGQSRYQYTHELLQGTNTFRGTVKVERNHRLSVIFRDSGAEDAADED